MKSRNLLSLLMVCMAVLSTAQPKYDIGNMQREQLNRGVVAIRNGQEVIVSWRTLESHSF